MAAPRGICCFSVNPEEPPTVFRSTGFTERSTATPAASVRCCGTSAPAFIGACCSNAPGGSKTCVVISDDACGFSFVYQGDNTSCATATCLGSPRGACCRADRNNCVVVDRGQAECDRVFGPGASAYLGNGTTCDETVVVSDIFNGCPPPPPPRPPPPFVCVSTCDEESVPTISEWGMASLCLVLLTGLTLKFRRALPKRA